MKSHLKIIVILFLSCLYIKNIHGQSLTRFEAGINAGPRNTGIFGAYKPFQNLDIVNGFEITRFNEIAWRANIRMYPLRNFNSTSFTGYSPCIGFGLQSNFKATYTEEEGPQDFEILFSLPEVHYYFFELGVRRNVSLSQINGLMPFSLQVPSNEYSMALRWAAS